MRTVTCSARIQSRQCTCAVICSALHVTILHLRPHPSEHALILFIFSPHFILACPSKSCCNAFHLNVFSSHPCCQAFHFNVIPSGKKFLPNVVQKGHVISSCCCHQKRVSLVLIICRASAKQKKTRILLQCVCDQMWLCSVVITRRTSAKHKQASIAFKRL